MVTSSWAVSQGEGEGGGWMRSSSRLRSGILAISSYQRRSQRVRGAATRTLCDMRMRDVKVRIGSAVRLLL